MGNLKSAAERTVGGVAREQAAAGVTISRNRIERLEREPPGRPLIRNGVVLTLWTVNPLFNCAPVAHRRARG